MEAESSLRHQEYVALQNQWEAEIQQAVDKTMITVSTPAEFCEKQPATEGSGISTFHPEVAGSGVITRTFAGRSGYFAFCRFISQWARFA